MQAVALGALALQGYAPASSIAPTLRPAVSRAGTPALNLGQRAQTAAIAGALAASLAVRSPGAALAADPWPYSTLLGKVSADEVAKVRAARPSTPLFFMEPPSRAHGAPQR